MFQFHVTLHACPVTVATGGCTKIKGHRLQTLAPSPQQASQPFALSFEQASEALAQLERMFVEPDGSLLWTGTDPAPWQVEGNLLDRAGRLLYVELWGACPPAAFDRLLHCLGWPDTVLMFQCSREAIFLDEPTFRGYAAG